MRGRGLLVGLELVEDRESKAPADALGAAVTEECYERGLSMNIVRSQAHATCFRIAPPLTVTEDEIDLAVEIMDASLRAVGSRRRPRYPNSPRLRLRLAVPEGLGHDEGTLRMASKRQTTMAKMARERALQEKRQRKQEKKEARKQAAADEAAGSPGDDTISDEADAVDGDDAASPAEADESSVPAEAAEETTP